jgi:hypothetical protein
MESGQRVAALADQPDNLLETMTGGGVRPAETPWPPCRFWTMSQFTKRYIFRFIHVRGPEGWSVQDTLSGQMLGLYASEDDAVSAALVETRRHSAFRSQETGGQLIPLA